jgi:FtsZ-binding cell division protein ZapB
MIAAFDNILARQCYLLKETKKMKIINKSKRLIDGLKPMVSTIVSEEVGSRLLKMYGEDIILIPEEVEKETGERANEFQIEITLLKTEVESLKEENETLYQINEDLKKELKSLEDMINEAPAQSKSRKERV